MLAAGKIERRNRDLLLLRNNKQKLSHLKPASIIMKENKYIPAMRIWCASSRTNAALKTTHDTRVIKDIAKVISSCKRQGNLVLRDPGLENKSRYKIKLIRIAIQYNEIKIRDALDASRDIASL